jgi:hypothetical protein
MAECRVCDDEFSSERAALGYDTCLTCGEALAKLEVDRRKKCIAPAYSKGAYTYVTSAEQVKMIHVKHNPK